MASTSSIRLHRFAISTVCVALVTLTMGALTTSKNAGMAFRDWPTSDGQNMLTYPWLADFAQNWDKFLEHGHRLAGALIGVWSIALVIVTFRAESRRWVQGLSIAILLGVICQGILGGFRVQLDERGLAMLHGLFAAIVFSLMGTMVAVTGPRWAAPEASTERTPLTILKVGALMIVLLLLLQYLLGGFIRHRGSGLSEHLGLGVVLLGLIFANATIANSQNSNWLRHSSTLLLLATLGQIVLGGATWILKYGFASLAYVAVADSIQQVAVRTTHTVWGIVVFMGAVIHCAKVFRVASVSRFEPEPPIPIRRSAGTLASGGNS